MIDFILPMKPMPKARPRVTRWSTYMPPTYVAYKAEGVRHVHEQWDGVPIDGILALRIVYTCKTCRGDADNCAGTIMDLLQEAGVYANDRAVRKLSVRVIEDPACKSPSIAVRVSLWTPSYTDV